MGKRPQRPPVTASTARRRRSPGPPRPGPTGRKQCLARADGVASCAAGWGAAQQAKPQVNRHQYQQHAAKRACAVFLQMKQQAGLRRLDEHSHAADEGHTQSKVQSNKGRQSGHLSGGESRRRVEPQPYRACREGGHARLCPTALAMNEVIARADRVKVGPDNAVPGHRNR